MSAANLADVRAETDRIQAEATFLRVLEEAGRAAAISQCMDCGKLYGLQFIQPAGPRAQVSTGLCDECGEVREGAAEKRETRAWGHP